MTSSLLSEVRPKPCLQLASLIETSATREVALDGRKRVSLFDSIRHNRSCLAQAANSPGGSSEAAVHESFLLQSQHATESQKLSPAESVATCATFYASTPSPMPLGRADLHLHVSALGGAGMPKQGAVQRSLCSLFDSMKAGLGDEVQLQHSVGMDASGSPPSPQTSSSSMCCGCPSGEAGVLEQLVGMPCECTTPSPLPSQSTRGALPHLLGRTRLSSQTGADKQSLYAVSKTEPERDSTEPDPCSSLTDFSVSLRNTFLHASPLRTSMRSRARSLPRRAC